jgi:mRNA interferase MazF
VRRGSIVLASLDPVMGSEQGKIRPVIVVSEDAATIRAMSHPRGMITVVPITSNASLVYEFQTLIPRGEGGLTVGGKAQAEQIRAISVTRVVRELGVLTTERLAAVDEALRVHLAL